MNVQARSRSPERRSGSGRGERATDTRGEIAIRVTNLTKRFVRADGSTVTPVDNVTLEVTTDDLVVLLGPSGCGKTTLLRCVAGLERPDIGEIEIDGEVVFSSERRIFVPPEKRHMNIVFQSYALWPHMSILDNIMYPLKSKRMKKADCVKRAVDVLELVGLTEIAQQYPGQISGGQQQRVALARALVGRDRVILFDEPLSNIDAAVRAKLRVELLSIKRKLGFTALYVTHDQQEAMELADRIAVLESGKVRQYDKPRTVYERPTTEYVGRFVGAANVWPGTVSSAELKEGIVKVNTEFGLVAAKVPRTWEHPQTPSVNVALLSRPEAWSINTDDSANSWTGEVEALLYGGAHTEYRVRIGSTSVRVLSRVPDLAAVGDSANISVDPESMIAVPAQGDST